MFNPSNKQQQEEKARQKAAERKEFERLCDENTLSLQKKANENTTKIRENTALRKQESVLHKSLAQAAADSDVLGEEGNYRRLLCTHDTNVRISYNEYLVVAAMQLERARQQSITGAKRGRKSGKAVLVDCAMDAPKDPSKVIR